MRTFVAIELPEEIRASLGELGQRLRESRVRASWVKPDRMHLTLRFLGEITEEKAAQVGDLLAEGYSSAGPFELSVQGVGTFANLRRPSVVWVGVQPADGALASVQGVAEGAAQRIGLPPEKRGFRPHLTLARIKEPKQASALVPLIEKEASFSGGSFLVSSVSLLQSRLTPKGPIYSHLRKIEFS